MEPRSLTAENFEAIEAMRWRYEDELAETPGTGCDTGAFGLSHPRMTARAIIAMLTGITTWHRPDGPLTPDGIADIYRTMVARLAGVGATATKMEKARCSTP